MNQTEKLNRIKRIVLIAGVFTALVSLLMMLNYMQIRGTQPLESRTLELLVERLSVEPNNQELIDEIRLLDLLARKAYFSSLWQIRTGAWLLLIGGIVLVVALRNYYSLSFSISPPEAEKLDERKNRRLAQRWIGLAAIIIFLLAGLSAFLSADHIKQFDAVQLAITENQPNDGIERIRITAIDDEDTEDRELTDQLTEEESGDAETVESQTDESTEARTESRPVALTTSLVNQNYNAFRGPWGNAVSNHRNIPLTGTVLQEGIFYGKLKYLSMAIILRLSGETGCTFPGQPML
jgi:outer membrane protein assembly factor BamB